MHSIAILAGWTFLIAWILLAVVLVVALRTVGARMSPELWTRLLLWAVPSWVAVILFVHAPFAVAGLVLIRWQAGNVEKRVSPAYAGPSGAGRTLTQFRAWWMWPYCSLEDGIDGLRGGDRAQAWWATTTRGLRPEQRIFRWSALRDPFNNLRYVPILRPLFRPASIRSVGTGDEPPDGQAGWAYVSQGLYSGLYIKTAPRPTLMLHLTSKWPFVTSEVETVGRWFAIGYKLRPSDAKGIDPTDTRLPRADFATQFQKVH